MPKDLKLFTFSLFAFAILDFIWFGFVVKNFNLRQLSEIGRIKDGAFDLLYAPAIATYLLMACSMVFFVLPKIEVSAPLSTTLLTGGLMGLIVYGIFDLTNLAILKNYPLTFVWVDLAWGVFVFALVTCLSKFIRDSA